MPIGANRIFHVNVNCSDLERSLAFYRDVLGLQQGAHTQPATPQPGGAFGLDTAQWDAWILTGDNGYDGVALDLLEWQVPAPTGTPPVANGIGFTRLGLSTPDVDHLHAALVEAGNECFGAPHDIQVEGAPPVRAFVFKDPDGTLIEAVGGDTTRIAFVSVNTTDLDRSVAFYRDVVGVPPLMRWSPPGGDGANLGIDGPLEMEMVYLAQGTAGTGFAIDLQHITTPPPVGTVSASANQLGIYRMAFTTDDIDRDHRVLVDAGVACVSPPADLEMGPGIPPLRALLFPDPDGTMLELIEPPT